MWYRRPGKRATLGIVLALAGIPGIAIIELLLMHADDRQQAFVLFNWANLAVLLILLGLIGFVNCTLRRKNLWIAAAAVLLRLAGAVLVALAGGPQDYEAQLPLPVIRFLG